MGMIRWCPGCRDPEGNLLSERQRQQEVPGVTFKDKVLMILYVVVGLPLLMTGMTYLVVWIATRAIQDAGGICP